MSTVQMMTAPEAAATTPRARAPKQTIPNPRTTTTPRTAAGSTVAPGGAERRRGLAKAVRNVGIAIDTTVRVVLLGRDGVRY